MRCRVSIVTFICIALSYVGSAQMKPNISSTNKPSLTVSVFPLGQAGSEPALKQLLPFVDRLPHGAFVLRNNRQVAVTAVVAQWRFVDKTGRVENRQIQCDGYVIPPVQPIVDREDVALITPGACTRSALFGRLDGAIIGSPLSSKINRDLLSSQTDLEIVEITLDSVIFEDGAIWGPDTQKYYTKIFERHVGSQAFVKEVSDAIARGEDIHEHAKKVREDAATRRDRASALNGHYASMLINSPNPVATLSQMRSRDVLPEFHHIAEEKK